MVATLERPTPIEIVGAYSKSAPVDLEAMAGALGLKVAYDFRLPTDVSGKIERAGDEYRITINALHAPRRRRFTLAHEIAHFVLHRDLIGDGVVDNAMYRSTLRSDLERQANRFAAELLMPAALVRTEWRNGVRSYAEMAAHFSVSDEAAQIRMRDLGLG